MGIAKRITKGEPSPMVRLEQCWLKFPLTLDERRSFKVDILNWLLRRVKTNKEDAPKFIYSLKGINVEFHPGDRVAILGRNGAGKTTLLRMIAGVYEPTHGKLEVSGSVFSLLNVSLGMDPFLSGRENVFARGRAIGLDDNSIKEIVDDVIEFSELGDSIDYAVKTYSSGMIARLSFGIATAIEADIYVMDEWIGAGDARFFNKAQSRIQRWLESESILFLGTHSAALAREWCNKAIVVEKGCIVKQCDVDTALDIRDKIMMQGA